MKNIIFAGTPIFSQNILNFLLDKNVEISTVLTQPDKPRGRGKKLLATPVKFTALEHNINVLQPSTLKSEVIQKTLHDLNPDLMIVAAYGLILPKAVLDIPKYGCINVHTSLLPKFRGAAPIQHAILSGDTQTGVTIMQMDKGMDTGDILLKQTVEIADNDTAANLEQKLTLAACPLLISALNKIVAGSLNPEKQNNIESSYAPKINKQDPCIDWNNSAQKIAKQIRAFNPHPIAYSFLNNMRLKIYSANIIQDPPTNLSSGTIVDANNFGLYVACKDCVLQITCLQAPGGRPLAAKDFINGHKAITKPGLRFTSEPRVNS